MRHDPVIGLILAGGRATRMTARDSQEQAVGDKGSLLLAGEPLVAHVARRLAPSVDRMLISANRRADFYMQYGTVLADDPAFGAWQGPLAGILAALQAAGRGWVACAACDTPFLPLDMVPRLLGAVREANAPLAVVRTRGRRQPLCMLARADLAPGLRAALLSGGRKVADWQTSAGAIEVDVDASEQSFANINTPADLAWAECYVSQCLKS